MTAAAVLTSVFAGPAAAEDPTPTSTAPATSAAPAEPPASTPPVSPAPESKPPAQPQAAPAERARVEVSIAGLKDEYASNEDVHFRFKLTNTGNVTATGVWVSQHISQPTDLDVPYDPGWGDLAYGRGIKLEPGQSYERELTGHIRDIGKDTVHIRGVVFDSSNFGVGEFDAKANVTTAPGEASGVVYGDKNGNGARDNGEELAGAKFTLRYVHGDVTYTATSDSAGNLTFKVPAADYYLGGDVVDGWLFPFRVVHIGEDTKLDLRGAPPLNGALKASMKFTQDSYKVGDLAHLTVTLSNSGKIPLIGIVAGCNRIGDPHILSGRTPGWGDLAAGGVTIAPGETRTFDVSEAVPQAAFNRGIVVASCGFGYAEVDIENHADARAQAWVPGAKAIVEGTLGVFDDQGEVKQALDGVKVVLVSDQHCPVTGERTTDAKGHFKFEDVAPGPRYRLYFLLPKGWKTKYENPLEIDVFGPPENHRPWRIAAEEGDAPLPAVPVNPADCTAGAPTTTTGPGGGTGGGQGGASGLASTGVDARGLGALALIALALGGGLVFGARRRRRTT
ncbi:prealbumin-like fold domain-containing protein [Amycolatopsis sp.]|uniref:prealbumin-like fold domain-containing protein n=1 Tax=Amycolatopsis sp. TaxID=37632 RepID=UPI002D7E6E72|nr:prealbumin-like fold domain-containing protein [Amycolatopsis sp.]HET6709872.1 prealbumin-like fold domain-containing protein [Amycolatopsis sp.]